METVCHDLRVKMPLLFSKLSHVNFEQVDDYQHFRQPSLGGRALGGQRRAGWSQGSPFAAFSLGPVSRVSLCRNRAWSRGAVNTIFSAAQSPTSLPICCMNATLCGFETRPVYIPSDLASEPCKRYCIFTTSLTLLFYGPSLSVSSFEAHFPASFSKLKIIPWHSLRLWASGLKIFFPCSSLNLPPSLVI